MWPFCQFGLWSRSYILSPRGARELFRLRDPHFDRADRREVQANIAQLQDDTDEQAGSAPPASLLRWRDSLAVRWRNRFQSLRPEKAARPSRRQSSIRRQVHAYVPSVLANQSYEALIEDAVTCRAWRQAV